MLCINDLEQYLKNYANIKTSDRIWSKEHSDPYFIGISFKVKVAVFSICSTFEISNKRGLKGANI